LETFGEGKTMNKKQLVEKIAAKRGMSKASAARALDAVLATMTGVMEKGERVTITGFGSFRVIERMKKKGRNPQTGQGIIIPARKIVKFKPGKDLFEKIQ
jgi:DNA-binding protein HU-beta